MPARPRNRSISFTVAVLDARRDVWQVHADRLGITLGAFVRKCVEAEVARREAVEAERDSLAPAVTVLEAARG